MKFSTFAERLLLYKANRSIARGERARIKEQELEREFAGYQRANKELTMWAERYPDHPYLYVISQEIERIDQDLRYNDLTRGRKMGIAAINGLRILRNKLPAEEVKKYDWEVLRNNIIGKGIGLSILTIIFLAVCHGPKTTPNSPSENTTIASATPQPITVASISDPQPTPETTPTPEPTPTPTPRLLKHRHHKTTGP